ncbi:uncharacterized protein JCM6883_004277 [Sporobolomyces salmoneus]|uniref:uncharacterized protein n=1 Tax=Sporobolomyces salmoneus TaxID=183962 RepID=UPI0031817932
MESSHVDPIPVYQEAEAIPSAVDSSSILIQSLPPLTLPTTPLHDSNNSELQTPVRPSPTDMDTLKRRSLDLSHSLNRLSRRATVCLSTLTALQPAFSSSTDDQAEVDGMREVAIGGEREAALIEEVLEDELKIVEKEVEEFVEGVVAAERAEDQEREEAMTKLGAEQKEGKENFHQVEWTVERGTNAEDFCLACEGMIRLAEYLTPSLAGLCTNEIGNELKKIRTRTTVENVTTLEEIILVEKNSRRKIATDAINWLLLMLKFGTRAYGMNLDSTEKEELSISFTRAWDQEYCKYFNFLVRPLFKILIKACPSRQTFYSKLGTPVRVAEEDFGEWLGGIEIVAERLEAWEESEKEKEKEKRVEQRKGKK